MTSAVNLLLRGTIVIEGIMLATAIVLLIVHALWRNAAERRRVKRFDHARPLFAEAMVGGLDERLVSWLLTQRIPHRVELCCEFAAAVHGHAFERLSAIAARVGVIAHAETCCTDRRWRRRLRGARALTALSSHHAVPGVAEALANDDQPLVRAQALEWISRESTSSSATLIVERLADPAPVVRFAAQDAVRRAGETAVQPLLHFFRTRTGSDSHAALNAVKGQTSPVFLHAVLELANDPCAETRSLATSMLGSLHGAESLSQLERALRDDSPAVRAAATHAIGQSGHWPAVRSVTPLLTDAHFGVRREAGLALRRLGAPGMLLLRNASTGEHPAAAAIARHVLSLPDPVFRSSAAA